METRFYTTQQAASRLGISVRAVQALLARRQLGRKLSRDWRLTEADITALMDRRVGRPRKDIGPPQ